MEEDWVQVRVRVSLRVNTSLNIPLSIYTFSEAADAMNFAMDNMLCVNPLAERLRPGAPEAEHLRRGAC